MVLIQFCRYSQPFDSSCPQCGRGGASFGDNKCAWAQSGLYHFFYSPSLALGTNSANSNSRKIVFERLLHGPSPRTGRNMEINNGQQRTTEPPLLHMELHERLSSIEKALIEHKRFESLLSHSSGRKEAILDSLPEPIFYNDASLRILWANTAASRLLGIDRHRLIGMHCYEVWQGRSTPCRNCPMESDEDIVRIRNHITGDGRTWRRVGRVIRNHAGRTIGVVEVATDVTDFEKTREALQREQKLTGALIEASPSFIARMDGEGRIIMMNMAMLEALDYTREEVLGSDYLSTFVPESDQEAVAAMMEEIVSQGRPVQTESKVISSDGRDFLVHWQGVPILKADGSLDSLFMAGIDVTDTRRLEAQLLRAQKLEAVGTLAGGIAHDFNNLLQAIGGYTDLLLLRRKEGDSDYQELLGIQRAAHSASELTEQLLAFSRRVKSGSGPSCVNSIVLNLHRILERTIPKMIRLELDLEEPPDAVRVDPAQIEQLLMNLCLNARDAMPEGGTLRIETRSIHLDQEFCDRHMGAKPGRHVRIRVTDTGHGIDPEFMQHVFEPFFTTKNAGKGSGLGLAMVYGIVKNHQGLITCESDPGRGTTFNVFFPATWGPVLQEVSPVQDPLPGGNELILLVDDDVSVRELGREILEKFGYEVLIACDGEEALAEYGKHSGRIKLVILDLIMPGMGGSKCLKGLVEINPEAKVLIASGYSPSKEEALLKGLSCGFIRKPYDMGSMLCTIRHVLDNHSKR